ncbi:tRNA pseudouridine(38-40) synthase TruA [Ignavibacteria bacterium 4148-Me]|uniref:tRNA pseudouridine(38-40) synthase TruA n=1 Tax=Rosettibacter primus TaxID=3111523 RepID=UPI00336C26AA
MNNFLLHIQYDGTNYAGWQIQRNAVTVQEKIIGAIEVILKERVNLIGSGRTDTGVHALGQAANFRTDKEIDLNKFQYSLNSILPDDISIKKIEKVHESFNARYDAKNRSYIYIFTHSKSPFFNKYSYLYPPIEKINIGRLNEMSKVFLGEHDFTSFSKVNEEIRNKICFVNEIRWRRVKDLTLFYISANRFLHGMVRTIIGTLLYASEKNLNENYLMDVLSKKDRKIARESVPAKGLFLYKVRY